MKSRASFFTYTYGKFRKSMKKNVGFAFGREVRCVQGCMLFTSYHVRGFVEHKPKCSNTFLNKYGLFWNGKHTGVRVSIFAVLCSLTYFCLPFAGKSFQQQRESLKKTITDRSREQQGEWAKLKTTDTICKLKHFASTLTHRSNVCSVNPRWRLNSFQL